MISLNNRVEVPVWKGPNGVLVMILSTCLGVSGCMTNPQYSKDQDGLYTDRNTGRVTRYPGSFDSSGNLIPLPGKSGNKYRERRENWNETAMTGINETFESDWRAITSLARQRILNACIATEHSTQLYHATMSYDGCINNIIYLNPEQFASETQQCLTNAKKMFGNLFGQATRNCQEYSCQIEKMMLGANLDTCGDEEMKR